MADETPSAEQVRKALEAVIDPELGINIVDLGLVYDVEIDEEDVLTVRYTLTTMGCGLGPLIEQGIVEVAMSFPVKDVRTELVFRPPWSPDMMTDETKAMLGIT